MVESQADEKKYHTTVVTGALNDLHVLGIKVLEYFLEKEGFRVVFAGAWLTQEDFIKAAIETDASAVLVSSSYGMAEIDCAGMREKCRESGIGDLLLYAGGNVTVTRQQQSWEDVAARFRNMGFDRVYPPSVTPEQVIADLKADLALP
ncbi:MAG: methylaspartate mutase subunit S [Chloroflexi bacterium]|nr:methylaspartate mutase subunit S [Chloroflexota bacterium]